MLRIGWVPELLLKNTNVHVVAANELLPKRAECYSHPPFPGHLERFGK